MPSRPRKGDAKRAAFAALYRDESDAVFRFCLIRTSRREAALDLVQEAFLRLWSSVSAGQEIENPRAFLFTIARNLIIDWYRRKKPESLEALVEEGDPNTSALMADTSGQGHELDAEARFVANKIAELEPQYREPVYLRFIRGLSPGEIADIMGISPNAASVRVNRGLTKLRILTGYDEARLREVIEGQEGEEG